jgi:hypothetical protein
MRGAMWHSGGMNYNNPSPRRPEILPPMVRVISLTDLDLQHLLTQAVQEGIRTFLATNATATMATATSVPQPVAISADLSPAAVRTMARCSAGAVSKALQSGELRGRKERVVDRRSRYAGDGLKKIPSYIWMIPHEEAENWIRRRNANKSRRN